jgi:hypothetical protein
VEALKPYALHIPLSDRERKAILKRSKELGLTQGQYARKLMYGKLEPLEAVKRADLTNGTWIKVKCPDMRTPLKLSNAKGER